MSKKQAPLVSIVNAVVLLKQTESELIGWAPKSVSKVRSAMDEMMLAYTALQQPWDVSFEEAVATAWEELNGPGGAP